MVQLTEAVANSLSASTSPSFERIRRPERVFSHLHPEEAISPLTVAGAAAEDDFTDVVSAADGVFSCDFEGFTIFWMGAGAAAWKSS